MPATAKPKQVPPGWLRSRPASGSRACGSPPAGKPPQRLRRAQKTLAPAGHNRRAHTRNRLPRGPGELAHGGGQHAAADRGGRPHDDERSAPALLSDNTTLPAPQHGQAQLAGFPGERHPHQPRITGHRSRRLDPVTGLRGVPQCAPGCSRTRLDGNRTGTLCPVMAACSRTGAADGCIAQR